MKLRYLLPFLFCAWTAFSQVPEATPRCVSESSDGVHWHSCGTSSSPSTGGDSHSQAGKSGPETPPCNPTGDPCLQTHFPWQGTAEERSRWEQTHPQPKYTQAYIDKLFPSPREIAEKPLEYYRGNLQGRDVSVTYGVPEKMKSLYGICDGSICGNGAVYRSYASPSSESNRDYKDALFLTDWADHLLQYPAVFVLLGDTNPYLMREVLDNLNRRTLDKVSEQLREQLVKLGPMAWDSFEQKQLKNSLVWDERFTLERYFEHFNGQKAVSERTGEPAISVSDSSCSGFSTSGKEICYRVQASDEFKFLMQVAQDGNWKLLDAQPWFQQYKPEPR